MLAAAAVELFALPPSAAFDSAEAPSDELSALDAAAADGGDDDDDESASTGSVCGLEEAEVSFGLLAARGNEFRCVKRRGQTKENKQTNGNGSGTQRRASGKRLVLALVLAEKGCGGCGASAKQLAAHLRYRLMKDFFRFCAFGSMAWWLWAWMLRWTAHRWKSMAALNRSSI